MPTGEHSVNSAISLATARAVAQLLDLPVRFPEKHDAAQFRIDLLRISNRYRTISHPLLLRDSFWAKYLHTGPERRSHRYDGYVKLVPPNTAKRASLWKGFAELRYDHYSYQRDVAVNRADCTRAQALSKKVADAIDALAAGKKRKRAMRAHARHQMQRCNGRR